MKGQRQPEGIEAAMKRLRVRKIVEDFEREVAAIKPVAHVVLPRRL